MRQAGLNVEIIEPRTVIASLAVVKRIYAGGLTKAMEDGDLAPEEIEAWWREQEIMDRKGTLYHAVPGYIVAASKP